MKLALILMAMHIALQAYTSSKVYDPLFDFFDEKKSRLVDESFAGLHFKIDKSIIECKKEADQRLICAIKGPGKAELIFNKHIIDSPKSLPLLLRNRKDAWSKKYPSINHYVEQNIIVDGKNTRLQQAYYFRFDNINCPVLLRAFDVVMNNRTSISVTAICDGRAWPAVREIVDSVVSTIYKAAK